MNCFQKNLVVKRFDLASSRLPEGKKLTFALIADVHGSVFEEKQEKIVRILGIQRPDLVLVAGDMIVKLDESSFENAAVMLKRLALSFPVYYGMGNHESRFLLWRQMMEEEHARLPSSSRVLVPLYEQYEAELKRNGVHILHNERRRICLKDINIDIAGLELENKYYRKPFSPALPVAEVTDLLGEVNAEAFQVLIAHNPRYARTYYQWGADLTVAGHYHGGILRLSEHTGLVSPYFRLFPPYCCGGFEQDGRYLIVSPGMGEHTLPVRIHNPRELDLLTVYGTGDDQKKDG